MNRKHIERRVEKELTAITSVVSDMLAGEMDDARVEQQVLQACLTTTDSVYGIIGVVNEHGKFDTTTYSSQTLEDCAFPEALARKVTTGMTIRGIWGWPLLHGEPLVCNDLENHPAHIGFPEGHVKLNCFLGVPLTLEGNTKGLLAVANKPGGYTLEDQACLVRLASIISLSQRHRRLLMQAQKTSLALEHQVAARTKQLQESEAKFRAMSSAAQDAIFMVDNRGKVIFWNTAAENSFGYRSEEIQGKYICKTIFTPEIWKDIRQNSHFQKDREHPEGISGGRTLDTFARHQQGGMIPIELSFSKVQINAHWHILGIIRDITDRRKTEQKARNYAKRLLAINTANHALVKKLDYKAVIERCVEIAKELFDADSVILFRRDEVKNTLVPIAYDGSYRDEVMAMRLEWGEGFTGSVAKQGQAELVNRIDLTDRGKQVVGTPREPESLMCAPLAIGQNVIGALTISRLGNREFEHEDLEFLSSLSNVAAAAIYNAQLYEETKQSDRLKSAFLQNISHEIRTPLNSILGFLEVIGSEIHDSLSDESKEYFRIIRNSSDRLMNTIQEILDLAQLESGSYRYNPSKLDLAILLKSIIEQYRPVAQSKGLDLKLSAVPRSVFIWADPHSIRSSIANLLDNAIKYTEKGHVDIRLTKQAGALKLILHDTGIGISVPFVEHAFEAFSQESIGYSRKFEGIGLGLAIVKRYLELEKIPITVESTKGHGTKFTLTFHVYRGSSLAQPGKKTVKAVKKTGVEKPLILVVDDDPNAHVLIQAYLQDRYTTCCAGSVAEAGSQLKRKPVDLVLLDISLKDGEDGLELARKLRKSKRYRKVPIITMTAHAFDEDRHNSMVSGCNDYLTKPVKKSELISKISQFL